MRARSVVRIGSASMLVLLVASAAVVALLFAVSRGLGRDTLRAWLEAEIGRQLGVPVRIAALEGPLVPGFTLLGLGLGPEQAPLVSVERLEVALNLATRLRGGSWTVEALLVDGLVASIRRSPDGSWQVPFPSAGGAEPVVLPPVWIRHLTLQHGRLDLRWDDGSQLALQVDLGARDLRAPFTAAHLREVSGSLELRLDPGRSSPAIHRAELAATVSSGRVAIARGVVEGRAGRLDFEGNVDLADWLEAAQPAGAELEADFSALDLGELSGRPQLSGALAGRARLEVQLAAGAALADAEAKLELAVEDSTSAAVESAQLRATLAGGRWLLSRCEVRGTGLELEAEGAGDGEAIERLRVNARVADLASFAPAGGLPEAAGQLALDLELSGPFRQLVGRASLHGDRLMLRGVALGSLAAELEGSGEGRIRVSSLGLSGGVAPLRLLEPSSLFLGDDAVTLEGLSLASDGGRLTIAGAIGSGFVRDLRLQARGLDVATLASLAGSPIPLEGHAEGELRLDGALPLPGIEAHIEWDRPGADSIAFGHLSARFESADRRLGGSVSVRDEDRELLSAEGSLPYDESTLDPAQWLASPHTSLVVRAESVELARFASLFPPVVEKPAGRIRLEFDLAGGEIPSGRGTVELAEGGVFIPALGRDVSPIRGSLRFEPHADGIQISAFELESAGRAISGHGVFDGVELHDTELRVQSLDADFAAPLLPSALEWSGAVDLTLTLAGPVARPEVAGSLLWRRPEIAGVPLESVEGEFELDGRIARGDLRVREGGREMLRIEGSAPYGDPVAAGQSWLRAPDARLALRGEGVELALLQPFLSRRLRELHGRVDASVELLGGVDPAARGSLVLTEGSVAVPLLRQTFAPIHGRLELTNDALVIEELRIGTSEAGGSLAGRVELRDLAPGAIDLRLLLNELPLARSPALKTDVAGELHLKGPLDALRFEGDVELHGLKVFLREEADASLREIRILANGADAGRRAELREALPAEPGAFERAAVDVRLRVPRNSWLRGRGTELDLSGGLDLKKQPFQPAVLVGRAEVIRGSYVFQNKRFEVRRGTATFDGSAGVDPLLDVEAAHRVRDVTVLIFLSGRASEPSLRIGSEPAMSESDALAYLFLGRPADQLGASERQGMESAATALATGVAAAQVTDLLTAALPIDTLDVKIDENGRPADVKVGKYVADRVFLRYGRTLGPEPEDEVGMEFRLNQNWSVGSEISTDESAGADLIWSLDY